MKNLNTSMLVATVAALCCTGIAQAGTLATPRSATVRFADLDTTTAQGAAVLYRRMSVAAAAVCGPREIVGTHFVRADWQRCVNEALRTGLARIGRPAVTAYAASRGVYQGDVAFRVASTR